MRSFLNKLERGARKIALPNLMIIITAGMVLLYLVDMILNVNVFGLLAFDRSRIFAGEVWRLLTFIFLPVNASPIFILITLYFYYSIGTALESQWGKAKFCLYYYVGIIGTILGGLIVGYATNIYLNLSLFFAFAVLFPETRFMLFFIIPIKAKWLGIANAVVFGLSFLNALLHFDFGAAGSIIVSILNFLLFFAPDMIDKIKRDNSYRKTRQNFRRQMRNNNNRW